MSCLGNCEARIVDDQEVNNEVKILQNKYKKELSRLQKELEDLEGYSGLKKQLVKMKLN